MSHDEDQAAEAVTAQLADLGVQVYRVDVGEFPLRAGFDVHLEPGLGTSWTGGFTGLGDIDLTSVDGIYYRKPNPFAFPNGLSHGELQFAHLEAQAGVLGVLAATRSKWINHPLTETPAAYKPLQLARASYFSLHPPRTLITNSRESVLSFALQHGGQVVHKGIGKDLVAPGSVAVPATRIVDVAELESSGGLEVTAHLFQEPIAKTHDVRVTAVGEWMCAVEIHTPRETLDWRTSYDTHEYHLTELPDSVRIGIRGLMSSFMITFATFDFAVEEGGRWRFLELNSNGEWHWLAQELGVPIAQQIARELVGVEGVVPHEDVAGLSHRSPQHRS